MYKLRILCLHGFTSNGTVHRHQLRRITERLPEYEFLFPDGPHPVPIADEFDLSKPEDKLWSDLVMSSGSAGHRAWWFAREGDGTAGRFVGCEESLDYLGTYLAESGPVHGIWGFSQGACLAGMLSALFNPKLEGHPYRKHFPTQAVLTPRAGIIFSGFKARFPQYQNIYEQGIDVPMLHVLGADDPFVQSARGDELIKVCTVTEILKHPGGHNIPKSEDDINVIVNFTRKYLTQSDHLRPQSSIKYAHHNTP